MKDRDVQIREHYVTDPLIVEVLMLIEDEDEEFKRDVLRYCIKVRNRPVTETDAECYRHKG